MSSLGLYLHIPYCRSKCSYCDFYSGGVKIADWENYTKAVLNELKSRKSEFKTLPDTLYLGGGTPSLIPGTILDPLITQIKENLNKDKDFKEFTLEVNPEDISVDNCKLWRKIGVNRISMGIQSFNDNELNVIGRRHTAKDSEESIRIIKDYFENVSIDLIFGLPLQTEETWERTLDKSFSLEPKHLSAYSLMLEPHTAISNLVRNGRITLPSENSWINMWNILLKKIDDNGFRHYEISNFAKPSFESIHNNSYWFGKPYIGLGPSAHSYDGDRCRKWNPGNIKEYILFYGSNNHLNDELKSSSEKFYGEEILSDKELEEEYIMTRLRTQNGINVEEFKQRFGSVSLETLLRKGKRFIDKSNLNLDNGYMKIARKSYLISDTIISSLF